MLYQYSPSKLIDKYGDGKYMKKHCGKYIAQEMSMFLNAVINATCALDIFMTPLFIWSILKAISIAFIPSLLIRKKVNGDY